MLANSSGAVASMVLDSTRLTVASSWLGIIMYTFQIYFDFSGYSDMAIGLGRMLGFTLVKTLNIRTFQRSITEFGEGGTYHCQHFSEITSIYRSAVTDITQYEIYS